MSRFTMSSSVSVARAMLILSACLVFGTLIGLMPHKSSSSGGQNLRSASTQSQLQQREPRKAAGGLGMLRPQIPDMDLSRSASPADNKEEARQELSGYVWKGDFAAAMHQTLDVDTPMDLSFSFGFEGSFSYDYYY